jgi:tRNA dimethylallyltransferase
VTAPVIAIFGPTGVGKTAVALELADRLRARGQDPVAISADALQVYRGLERLTGAASAEEQARLEHRLIGFVRVEHTFSVGEFMPLAHREIDAALEAGRVPIVVGGTGLYLRAALQNLDLRPAPPPEVRERWEREMEIRGPKDLHRELAQRAPGAEKGVEPGDRSRIIRLLELAEMGALEKGALEEDETDESQLWSGDTRHPTVLAGLTMDRDALDRQIDARTEAIVAAGAREEVERAAATASATARKALGFEQLLAGDVEDLKRDTRRLARRQLTWMRKLAGVTLVDLTGRGPAEAAVEIEHLYRSAAPGTRRPAPA